MTNIINEVKIEILKNPRKADSILESVSSKHNTSKDAIVDLFINHEQAHPYVYAAITEAGLFNNALGSIKDAAIAKYGVGGARQRAIGSQQKREKMNELFRQWSRLSSSGKLQASEQSMKAFLTTMKVMPESIKHGILAFKAYFRPDNIAGILPNSQLRAFFTKIVELEIQNALKASDAQPTKAKTNKLTKDELMNLELYISKLTPDQRKHFNTEVKNFISK